MITQLELLPRLPIVRDPSTYYSRYKAYLRSSHWAWIRRTTLAMFDYQCQAQKPGCDGHASEVHHVSYLRWNRGGDRPGIDTTAICAPCHRWIHAHPIILKAANDNDPDQRALPLTGS